MKNVFRFCCKSVVVLLLSSYAIFAYSAGALNVSPTKFNLSAQQTTAVLTLTNQSDTPDIVQIQAYLWTRNNKQDVYTKTQDLLISPPIITIPPHTAQIIRIMLRRAPDPKNQLRYRIYAQEIPSRHPDKPAGIQIALRFGIPVYVAPLTVTL
jgi:fimbrial chaperone protein